MESLGMIALVALGGGVGSVMRWATGVAISSRYKSDFPMATFLINVSGSFAMGLISTLLGVDWFDRLGTAASSFILTGLLGGYTTFSSYELDTAITRDGGSGPIAAFYWVASIAGGLLAVAGGFVVAGAVMAI